MDDEIVDEIVDNEVIDDGNENEPETEEQNQDESGNSEEVEEGQEEQEQNEEPKPKKSGYQKRIDKLTAEKYAMQAQIQAMQQAQTPQAQAFQPKKEEVKAPVVGDFESVEEYVTAQATYQAEKIVNERLEKQTAVAQKQAGIGKYQSDVANFKIAHPDFDAIVNSSVVQLSDAVGDAIVNSNKGAAITYYLAQNPDKALAITQLPTATAQIMAIGKLEAMATRPKKVVSKAPRPPSPTGGSGNGIINKDLSKMSPDEYRAYKRAKTKGK